jgi:hypothetical protein
MKIFRHITLMQFNRYHRSILVYNYLHKKRCITHKQFYLFFKYEFYLIIGK